MRLRMTRKNQRRGHLIIAALWIGAVGGCTKTAPHTDPRPVIPRSSATTVVVRNHHGADLRIYVITAGGRSHRLGIAPRNGSATLELPRALLLPAALTFVAVPLGHEEPQMSSPVAVDVGTKLVFTVTHIPSASTLTKRP